MTRGAMMVLLAGVAAASANGQVFDFDRPSDDRWVYPFNTTPGGRLTASTFAYVGPEGFNNRDGQIVVRWDTSALIAPGQPIESYDIESIRVVLINEPNASDWTPDLTSDEWFTFDLNGDGEVNADGIARGEPGDTDGESDDVDPGRPLEIFGVGFGPDLNAATWTEFAPYFGANSVANFPRDPFPFVFQAGTGERLHVEDHIFGFWNDALPQPVLSFTPEPWAVGEPIGYTPNAQASAFEVRFDLDLSLSDGRVLDYFRSQLADGYISVAVTSAQAVEMLATSGFARFYMKEGADLANNPALAPRLQVTLAQSSPCPGDLTGPSQDGIPDGTVDASDLTLYLDAYIAQFGTTGGGGPNGFNADLTGPSQDGLPDGTVDASDLTFYLDAYVAGFGPCQ